MASKLLIIGDERQTRRMLAGPLADGFLVVQVASSGVMAGKLLEEQSFHAACIDTRLLADDPISVAALLRRRVPRLIVVALLAERDRRLIAGLRAQGVDACLVSPFASDTLRAALCGEATWAAPVALPSRGPALPPYFVARDHAAKRTFEIALRAAASNVPILILGETGTGKNLLAQTIHDRSPLAQKPCVTVNCPSLKQELLESELFGHVRGAFTGAIQDTWGKVAAAEGGTLFLDEIGDLPAGLQPKLLRLLQEKQYERVGEATPRTANVRIIAATNRDLKAEVEAGRFREDLYYRLNVIAVEVPPLRSRPADIMVAAEEFLASICRTLGKRTPTLAPEVRRLFEAHAWPGNLRELRNVVERAAILSDATTLDVGDFPTLAAQPSIPRYQVGAAVSLRALEAAHIRMVVANTPTLEEAARILEIDKSTLYRKRKTMKARVASFPRAEQPAKAAEA